VRILIADVKILDFLACRGEFFLPASRYVPSLMLRRFYCVAQCCLITRTHPLRQVVLYQDINKATVQKAVESIIRLYEAVWPSVRSARAALLPQPTSEFFSMRISSNANTTHAEFVVTLRSQAPFNKFGVLVIDNREYGSPGRELPHVMMDSECPRKVQPPKPPKPSTSYYDEINDVSYGSEESDASYDDSEEMDDGCTSQ
jgi:hypothetical protein